MTNEERILAMLEGLTETVAKQGEQLAAVQAAQAKQGEQLNRIETVQTEHGARLETLDARSLKSAVLLETEVACDIHLIYEGHSELKRGLDTLATKEQVEYLSGEVGVIKEVVTRHSSDISKLKKAQ